MRSNEVLRCLETSASHFLDKVNICITCVVIYPTWSIDANCFGYVLFVLLLVILLSLLPCDNHNSVIATYSILTCWDSSRSYSYTEWNNSLDDTSFTDSLFNPFATGCTQLYSKNKNTFQCICCTEETFI